MNTNGLINKTQEQYTKDEQKHTTNTSTTYTHVINKKDKKKGDMIIRKQHKNNDE